MAKAINDDICIQGSTLIIGIKFPPIDDIYSLTTLLNAGNLTVKYYIINTEQKYTVSTLYTIDNVTDDNSRAFTVSNTDNLTPGELMVYYNIPGTPYTARSAGESTPKTSNYFAIETYSAVDVSAANVKECGDILMLEI